MTTPSSSFCPTVATQPHRQPKGFASLRLVPLIVTLLISSALNIFSRMRRNSRFRVGLLLQLWLWLSQCPRVTESFAHDTQQQPLLGRLTTDRTSSRLRRHKHHRTKRQIDPWNDDRSIIIMSNNDTFVNERIIEETFSETDNILPAEAISNDNNSFIDNPQIALFLLNFVAILWGTQHAIIKSVVTDTTVSSAAAFTLCRFALATCVALPAGISELISNKTSSTTSSETGVSSISSALIRWGTELGLWMFLGFAFQAVGLETTTAQKSGFLLYLNVKFVPFLAWMLYGRQIRATTWVSAATAVLGTALMGGILLPPLEDTTAATTLSEAQRWNVGDVWSIAAATASAMFILRLESASRALPKNAAALNAVCLVVVTSLAALWTGMGSNTDSIQHIVDTFTHHMWEFLYLGVVTTAVANWIQTSAQKYVSAERASLIYAMDPVYGAAFAYMWLGEALPGAMGWVGAVLIGTAAASNAWLEWNQTALEKVENAPSKSKTTGITNPQDKIPRGGALSDSGTSMDESETAELDAYIAQLLDDEADETKVKSDSNVVEETETSEIQAQTKAVQTSKLTPSSSSIRKTTPKKKKPLSTAAKKKKLTRARQSTPSKASSKASEAAIKTEDRSHSSSRIEQNNSLSPNLNETDTATPVEQAPPPRPPNALLRFLMRRVTGFGGRSLVMMLVGVAEFCHTYIPPLAHVGSWAWISLFPAAARGGTRGRRRPPSTSMAAASLERLSRTGVSRRRRRKLTQQADQQALRQLKRQPPSSDLRYTFCTDHFLQRHGLGKFSSSRIPKPDDEWQRATVDEGEIVEGDEASGTKLVKRKKRKKMDWVLAALTKESPRKHSPGISLDIGSGGLTIGFEMDWSGQKERVRAGLTLPVKPASRKSATATNLSPRKSDANGGVVGRLRAAAGSSMARSLSGAYPGDALGVEEAGSASGLTDFASRYGWGDWMESDEDSEDFGQRLGGTRAKRKRKRSTKHHRKQAHQESWDNFDIPISLSSTRSSRRAQRTLSPEPILSSSKTLTKRRSHVGRTSTQKISDRSTVLPGRQVEMADSPLSGIEKLKKKKKRSGTSNDDE